MKMIRIAAPYGGRGGIFLPHCRNGFRGDRGARRRAGTAAGAWAALGTARRAAPDEEAPDRAGAAPVGPAARLGAAFDLLDVRKRGYVGPLRHLPRSAPRREKPLR